MDGSALINSLPHVRQKYLMTTPKRKYFPELNRNPQSTVVFDVFKQVQPENSSKVQKRQVTTNKTPQNCKSFLRNNDKTELFHFLSHRTTTVKMTKGEEVCCNRAIALKDLAPCTHEEANTRIFVHARHVVSESRKAVMGNVELGMKDLFQTQSMHSSSS